MQMGAAAQKSFVVALALLSAIGCVVAQPAASDLERCRSVDVSGSTISSDDAIAACGSVISNGSVSGRALAEMFVLRAVAYLRKNDNDRALADYSQAVRIDPTYPRAYNGRGVARYRKNDLDGAFSDYNEAIRFEQNFGRAYDNRGLIFRQRKDYDRAIADFSEAIRIEPNRAAAYSHRGWTWYLKKDFDRAIADYDVAIRLDSKFGGVFNDRGVVWRDKGEPDRALADFNEALRLDAKLAIAWVNRGYFYRAKRDLDRAMVDFNEAIKINPNLTTAYLGRGYTNFLKKDYDAALADYNKAVELDPKSAIAHNDRGLVWRSKGQPAKAIADYNEAIRLNPNYAFPYSNRARSMRANGDIPRAIVDFTQALKLDPNFTAVYTDRGLAYEAKGERDKALEDFRTALATPQKYDNGKWAHDTARARLALLTGTEAPSPQTASRPTTAPQPSNNQAAAPPGIAPAPPGSRVALVIGNAAYQAAGALPNPANDARAVAKALRDIGFDVSDGINLDHRSQERLVRDFLRKAAGAKVALLFYAGHGMQVDGKNYLVPVDARLQAATDLPFETLELDKIIAGLDDESRTNIIILDACRDNPLAKAPGVKARSAAGSGLAAVSTVGSGTLIAYATAPGAVALDGDGSNSPFTAALVKHIRTPGLEVRQMLTRVRSDVASVTQKKQIPWDNSSLLGEVYLAGTPKR